VLSREQPIADGLGDPAVTLGDPGIDQFVVQHLHPSEFSRL
jgi:hypothetical protein